MVLCRVQQQKALKLNTKSYNIINILLVFRFLNNKNITHFCTTFFFFFFMKLQYILVWGHGGCNLCKTDLLIVWNIYRYKFYYHKTLFEQYYIIQAWWTNVYKIISTYTVNSDYFTLYLNEMYQYYKLPLRHRFI